MIVARSIIIRMISGPFLLVYPPTQEPMAPPRRRPANEEATCAMEKEMKISL